MNTMLYLAGYAVVVMGGALLMERLNSQAWRDEAETHRKLAAALSRANAELVQELMRLQADKPNYDRLNQHLHN